jgi:asparagine synthetase B (glutamine-hydrolysing)
VIGTQPGLVVTNFLWIRDQLAHTLDLSDPAGRLEALSWTEGQFSLHQVLPSEEHVLARDALGINKLFYAIDETGNIQSSNYWIELIRCGCAPEAIWSVPSGHVLCVTARRRALSLRKYAQLEFSEDSSRADADLRYWAQRIRARLRGVFRRIRDVVRERKVYVTLSGGLDSTVVAVLAREFIGQFTAVSFAVDSGDRTSEDLRYAERLARELGVPLAVVLSTSQEILSSIDTVLHYGQDWRDFNVHCGLVTAALGRAIRDRHRESGSTSAPVVLTGDVMNDLMADYTAVRYNEREYYSLPRLSPARLRRFLVAGLDAGDREVGIFRHFGIDVLQPYAMCAAEYAALPPALVDVPRAKQQLVQAVMGNAVPPDIYSRPKTRAQAASANQANGTLAVLVDNGVDETALERRFAHLYSLDAGSLRQFIRAGFYRFTCSYPISTARKVSAPV